MNRAANADEAGEGCRRRDGGEPRTSAAEEASAQGSVGTSRPAAAMMALDVGQAPALIRPLIHSKLFLSSILTGAILLSDHS
jgi:hypothetical protein